MLSVVIPAYNEAARIPAALETAHAWLVARGQQFEIVVVDDGSTDATSEVVLKAAKRLSGVRLVSLEENRGKGAALRCGVEEAAGEWILTSDADFSAPIEEFEKIEKELLAGADIVIASREHAATVIPVEQHVVRRSMGRVFNLGVRLLTGLAFADTQCGFKGFRGEVAKEIYRRTRIDGFATDVEVLVIARALGARVSEIGVVWAHMEGSRVHILRHPVAMLHEILTIRRNERLGLYRKSCSGTDAGSAA